MKAINKVCQILGLLTGVAALVMFFSDFASIRIANVAPLEATGAELAFGAKVGGYALHKSYKLLFCFLVAVLTVVLSGFSFKSKGAKYATPISAAVVAVFMLVVTLGDPFKFVNGDGLAAYSIKYVFAGVITVTALLFASMLFSAAHLFINDYIECAGKKPTLLKRIVKFFRDYKSEAKKIVWPSFKDVVKNTVIVLIMCVIVGAFIWVLDFGLSKLLSLIWSIKVK